MIIHKAEQCKLCYGYGYYEGSSYYGADHPRNGEPVKVKCWACDGRGEIPIRES